MRRLSPAALRTTAAIAAALVAAAPAAARACSVCSRGDPLASLAEGHGAEGRLRLSLETEYLTQQGAMEGSPTQRHDLQQVLLRAGASWTPLSSLDLVASVPFGRKKLEMQGATVPMSDLTGLGDLDVGARWFFWEAVNLRARQRQGLALTVGSSLPTGSRDPGAVEHGQVGTGAFGPYAGLAYRLQRDAFAAVLSVSGRVHDANGQGYRYGSALLGTAQGLWTPTGWLVLGAGMDLHDEGRDRRNGLPVANTGGLVVWASPSAFLKVYRELWFSLRVQVPVHSALLGIQEVGAVGVAGFQYQAM